MLQINTFDQRQGGNVLYKALAHPLAAEALAALADRLRRSGPVALVDPERVGEALYALCPEMPKAAALFVQDVRDVGRQRLGLTARPLTSLPESGATSVLIAAFDAARTAARLTPLLAPEATCLTLDAARLPDAMLTNPRRTLDRLNFATNHVFFRDQDGVSTRLVTANYWSGYGAKTVRLWLRLFDAEGRSLATWEEPVPEGAAGIAIDSRDVRRRFELPEFTGQLFLHVIGAAGHDVVKYALDTFAEREGGSLSCTHDANAWPAERYAGLPAPREDERVILWLQNSHAAPIPARAVSLDRMGAGKPVALDREVPGFATIAVDPADYLPGVHWPAQIELHAGCHVVRPRYEVVRAGRTRIAHVNVERADLLPDPGIKALGNALGRGFLLPFPVLPQADYRTFVQPNPMAHSECGTPIRLDIFDTEGRCVAERFLGCLPRDHNLAVEVEAPGLAEGHAELVYDFRDGGEANGWLHALMRYEHRASDHAADTSFGAHIFNTVMTYKDEPQSYSGPPPGLTTRLFLKLGNEGRRSFGCLIYPASAPWHALSQTVLILNDGAGRPIAERHIAIACSGSATVRPHEMFGEALIEQAGPRGYVLIRDATCRLFGYHGLEGASGAFSFDHMFGF